MNPKPGTNFSFGRGMGIAIVVEKSSAGPLTLPAGSPAAGIRVAEVRLDFVGRTRNEKVKV